MNYLLEIGTEEIPARFVQRLVQELKTNIFTNIHNANIAINENDMQTFASYRRLTVFIKELDKQQKDVNAEYKGPPLTIAKNADGSLSQAGSGFLKKWNTDTFFEKDGYLYAKVFIKGKKTIDVLAELIINAIRSTYLPIAMNWGTEKEKFIRPVHWIISLLDNNILPLSFAGKTAGNITYGHRFLSGSDTLRGKESIISNSNDYEKILNELKVIVDANKRKDQIVRDIKNRYSEAVIDDDLLNEVTYLVEYPTILEGHFPKDFLNIPDKILVTSMKKHQKYFPVYKKGSLQNTFLMVADNVTPTNSDNIIMGNERVLTARLHDAQFFYHEDTKRNFDFFNEKLKSITFQQKLGSIADKNNRNLQLAEYLYELLKFTTKDKEITTHIIQNQKADLSTSMVFEFTELQGYVGQQYALKWGYDKIIADGIYEHYLPSFAGDKLPSTLYGTIASLSDKLDTICSHFSIGNIPSGSQDPYALRRQANGIVQILLSNNDANINIESLIKKSLEILNFENTNQVFESLCAFFETRISTILKDQELPMDIIKAVTTLDISLLKKRIDFVKLLKEALEYKSIIEAIVRVQNITKDVKKTVDVDQRLFKFDIEKTLFDEATDLEILCNSSLWNEATLHRLARSASIITAYFNEILVMDADEKIKNNRLSCLYSLSQSASVFANFKELNT
ncbi:MAG: glycine--tRNA ligase subunit beta [Candidatus Margulisbacteria bacterium GWF2_35_9]|nr:MAG: glycine--tRNA ligase subunit beta [Candidatus Margulisbacteria bacterium GWF2_35_9]